MVNQLDLSEEPMLEEAVNYAAARLGVSAAKVHDLGWENEARLLDTRTREVTHVSPRGLVSRASERRGTDTPIARELSALFPEEDYPEFYN